MSTTQNKSAARRFSRENEQLCAACHGTGRVLTQSALARARRGGNASYLVSLSCGRLSMSERAQKGGRPRELTLEDLTSTDS